MRLTLSIINVPYTYILPWLFLPIIYILNASLIVYDFKSCNHINNYIDLNETTQYSSNN
jgi:hypothetical protein